MVRGRSAIAVLGSECCYWRTEEAAASSDEEVVAAAAPALSMCPDGGLLILGSSVYRRKGCMYKRFQQLHGNDAADDLCWLAPSTVMDPLLPVGVFERALADDPMRARGEYLSLWRSDLSDFIPSDVIDSATDHGVRERAPLPGVRYTAFCDAAGGTGPDSFTVCVAHAEPDGTVMIDAIRARPPRLYPGQRDRLCAV